MSVQADLYTQLSTYAGLIALISTRTYPNKAPDGVTSPYCVYTVISGRPFYSHQGNTGLYQYRLQISCFAKTYDEVRSVVAQVIAAMDAWPAADSDVHSCFLDDDFDIYEEESEYHHVPLDFIVKYG